MIYINLLIIILIILLAVLGRKNKSKYKAVKGFLTAPGEAFCTLTDIYIPGLEKLIKRSKVMTDEKAQHTARSFIVDMVSVCLWVIFMVNLLSLVYGISGVGKKSENNLILRQEYGGDESTYELVMTDSEGEESYQLNVAAVEYTQEEFYERADTIYTELSESILGENTDLQHITSNLCLSDYDDSGLIHLSWSSERPELLSSDGGVDASAAVSDEEVRLSVTMEYSEYEKSYSYLLIIRRVKKPETGFEAAKEILRGLEEEGRKSRELLIPSEVAGVSVEIAEEKDYTQVKLMILGILVCSLCVCVKYFGLREKGEKADATLEAAYVGFVEALILLMESGMTVKRAVSYLAMQPNTDVKLSDELKYAINMMDTGYDEAIAFEQLGGRLALPEYVRLFNYISQNIRKGNSNLKAVLNNCAYEAAQTGREQIRKRGEKTSTKLLFPMVMLLAVVMMIIIVPALISF